MNDKELLMWAIVLLHETCGEPLDSKRLIRLKEIADSMPDQPSEPTISHEELRNQIGLTRTHPRYGKLV